MAAVEKTINNRVATLTLSRPEKRNAMDDQLVGELKAHLDELAGQDEVRALILTGSGKAFCAGADLGYLQKLQSFSYEENLEDSQNLRALFEQIWRYPKPVIAKVNGHAIAGGCGLATVCDFVFAARRAKFGYTEVRIGFVPALVSVFLARKIGEARARELLLSGSLIGAEEARQAGLVLRVLEKEDLGQVVEDFAQDLVRTASPASYQLTKELLDEVYGRPLDEALNRAAHANAEARNTEDCKKGIKAFLDKEELVW